MQLTLRKFLLHGILHQNQLFCQNYYSLNRNWFVFFEGGGSGEDKTSNQGCSAHFTLLYAKESGHIVVDKITFSSLVRIIHKIHELTRSENAKLLIFDLHFRASAKERERV